MKHSRMLHTGSPNAHASAAEALYPSLDGAAPDTQNRPEEPLLHQDPLFPGVTFSYRELHAAEMPHGPALELFHCWEGHAECRCGDRFFCFFPGDLFLCQCGQTAQTRYFYHFRGTVLSIDPAAALRPPASVDLAGLPHALTPAYPFCAVRACPALLRLVPPRHAAPPGGLRTQVLALLPLLNRMHPASAASSAELRLYRQAQCFLSSCFEERITIDTLAQTLGVSATRLKTSFRHVCGQPVHTFFRTQKMLAAAGLLLQTDRTVLDIAGRLGYDNGSKFAQAFRQVMGVPPRRYRLDNEGPGREHCSWISADCPKRWGAAACR